MPENELATILIVDDQIKNLKALEAILAPLKRSIIRALSGDEALEVLLNQEIALIILDVNMPGMNGFETAEIIRERDQTRYIPIIFLTADGPAAENILKAYQLGAVNFIFKPILDDEIVLSKVSVFVEMYEYKMRQRLRDARELASLEFLSHGPQISVNEQIFGARPLREVSPVIYNNLVESFQKHLEQAIERLVKKIDDNIGSGLKKMAEELGSLKAGPRDVIDIYIRALNIISRGAKAQKSQAYADEGKFLALELMGNLVTFYRSQGNHEIHNNRKV